MSDVEGAVSNSVIEQRAGGWAAWRHLERSQRLRIIGLGVGFGLLTLSFVQPLARLLGIALQNDLHSYIPLVPAISGYLLYTRPIREIAYRSSIGPAIMMAAIGIAALGAAIGFGKGVSEPDNLSLMMLAYVCFNVGSGFLFLGSEWMRAAAFPVAFLTFMVPLPEAAATRLELALVAASADAAALFFRWTGTPMFREGVFLSLPGITLHVAQECSGIRSTVVLFITSVLAANLFLRSAWRRFALVAFVIPLAIVRNGFRILVIGLLCVHIGPHMRDSFIHHRGGPIFFVLSLVPLSVLLFWLRRHDRRMDTRT
jgi:exosortase C (VPDSG-CTERM-specific)